MARIEVYLPGDGSFTAHMSDEALTDLALGLAKNFNEENGSWISVTSAGPPKHWRWVPSSAGVALFYDSEPAGGAFSPPSLSLVV